MIDTDKYEGLSEVIDRIINSDEIGVDDLLADSMAIKDGINELLAEVKCLTKTLELIGKRIPFDPWLHTLIKEVIGYEKVIE